MIEAIRNSPSIRLIAHPAFDTHAKSPRSDVRMEFQSFRDLLSVFCDNTTDIMRKSVVKMRLGRRTSNVTALRIIDILLQSESDELRPMNVVMGCGALETWID